MQYVIYGAGAIGGVIGGRLLEAGRDVVFIARGEHLQMIQRHGLRMQSPMADRVLQVRAVASPRDADLREGDVAVLAVKSQDTAGVIDELARAAPRDIIVICAQNGVENERLALRHFPHVYGSYVYILATHLLPGVVQYFTDPYAGVIDIGRYPAGVNDVADQLSNELRHAGFDSCVRSDIMRWKYAKLLANTGNALQAVCRSFGDVRDIYDQTQAEAVACYQAAGIDFVATDEATERQASLLPYRLIEERPFPGGSTWQSLARGSGRVETDYLNGEIVLLGRLHGVPTPVNELLQGLARRLADGGLPPASLSPVEMRARVAEASGVIA